MPLTPKPSFDREHALYLLKAARQYASHESAQSIIKYLHHVVIDSRPEPSLYRAVAEPWQWTLISKMIPAIETMAGVRPPPYTGPSSFWLTLPRGHDKSSSIGRLMNWALAYSRKPLRSITAAADREQAGFILEFMQTEAGLNPWLDEKLTFRNWRVDGVNQSQMRVLAADDKSAYGLKEDLMILDEITQWNKPDLWHAIASGREKRPGAVLIVITNAGVLKSWQHTAFQMAKSSPYWYVYEAPHRLASWMSDERINDLRRMLPRGLAKRLYDNIWVDAAEDCQFVTREEVQACVDNALVYRNRGISSHSPYYAAIDYGPVRDRTVMCVLHMEEGRIILDRMDAIQGSSERRVPISLIEDWIDEIRKAFPNCNFVVDPYSLEGTIQKYQGLVEMERFEARGGKANYEMAANLRNLLVNGKMSFYPRAGELYLPDGRCEDIVDEISEVSIKPMAYGYRIINDGHTHDDRTVALGMAALQAVKAENLLPIRITDRYF